MKYSNIHKVNEKEKLTNKPLLKKIYNFLSIIDQANKNSGKIQKN